MSTENVFDVVTLTASGNDLSAANVQFSFGKLGATDGQCVLATAGDKTYGVFQDSVKNGEGMGIVRGGSTKIRLGATVSAPNTLLKPNASGLAVPDVGDLAWKGAMSETSGVTNEVIRALVIHSGGSSAN